MKEMTEVHITETVLVVPVMVVTMSLVMVHTEENVAVTTEGVAAMDITLITDHNFT